MSGIFGYFDPDHVLPADAADRMARALAVASGSRVSTLTSGATCIGVVDKGILPGTSEILHSESHGRYAVFQGEILPGGANEDHDNAVTRARRLLCAPLENERLAAANGPFAAAILDTSTGGIELVGDRYQRYLTFYVKLGRAVLFSGAMKALLATGVVRPSLDRDALGLMLSIGEVVGDLTLIEGIRAVPSGTVARIDGTGIRLRSFWRYTFHEAPRMGFEEAAEQAGRLLRQAVGRVCASHASPGVPLSGGLDSRMLLAASPNPSGSPSFTWGIANCRDLVYAARTAATLGSPHSSYVYDPTYPIRLGERGVWLTEGLCDAADMHVLPYVETVAERASVLLDGFAGDVLLGGNFIKRQWWEASGPPAAAAALWSWRAGMLKPDLGRLLLGPEPYDAVVNRSRRLFCECFAGYAAGSEMNRAMAFLMDNRMRRCSSGGAHLFRWRVELHMPFYDNDLFDHVASLPHAWRYRHRLYVEMIRRCFPAVGGIRWQRTGLPARTRWAGRFLSAAAHRANEWAVKRLGSPDLFSRRHVSRFDLWFRGPLRGYLEEVALSERFLARGIVRPDGVRAVIREHDAGANHSKLLGVLIALELFHRLFVDDLDGAIHRFGAPLRSGQRLLLSAPADAVA